MTCVVEGCRGEASVDLCDRHLSAWAGSPEMVRWAGLTDEGPRRAAAVDFIRRTEAEERNAAKEETIAK